MNDLPRPWDPGPVVPVAQPEPRRERRGSIYETQWFAEVALPAGLGVLFALPTAIAITTNEIMQTNDLPGRVAPSCGIGILFACIVFAVVAALVVVARRALWTAEAVTGLDLYHGGPVDSKKDVPTLHFSVADPQTNSTKFGDFGIPAATMYEVARRVVVGGQTLSHRNMTGGGNPLSKEQLETLQQALIDTGLAQWRSDKARQQGVELTSAGRGVFTKLAVMGAMGDAE